MRVLRIPDSGPKKKLLDATERLVVEKGFDLVSIRDITTASKANVAAVNYHFGSREGLMDLVALRVMEPLVEERLKALEAIENPKAAKPSIEEIITAYVRPLFSAAARLEMEPHFFLKLAGRVLVLPDDTIFPALATNRTAVSERFLDAISKSLPNPLPPELEISWRFFENGLGQTLVALREDSVPQDESAHWIAFGARGLGNTKEKAPKPKKGDNQAMLFDL